MSHSVVESSVYLSHFNLVRCMALLAPLFLAAGCSSARSPVTGKVTYEDGTPVENGTVVAEATVDGKLVGVQANIEPDGSFSWGSDLPGDGALPGSYRVMLMPATLSDFDLAAGKKPAIGGKYGSFESSGITFDVQPGPNELNIKIAKP